MGESAKPPGGRLETLQAQGGIRDYPLWKTAPTALLGARMGPLLEMDTPLLGTGGYPFSEILGWYSGRAKQKNYHPLLPQRSPAVGSGHPISNLRFGFQKPVSRRPLAALALLRSP